MTTGLITEESMANTYKPYLVLYPEIASRSHRKDHYRRGHAAGHPPIDQDYHPRDIGIVLDNAFMPGFRGRTWKMSRSDLLAAMSANKVDRIDLVLGASPGNVDKFWQVYAGIPEKDRQYIRKAYARIARGSRRYSNYLVIQYWMAYFFDDWANVHEMDWEMASIIIKKTKEEGKPVACAFQVHTGGFRLAWPYVEKVNDKGERTEQGTHPVVYVANGSHACYFHDEPVHEAAAAILGPRLSTLANSMPWVRKTFSDYVPSFDKGDKHFPEIEMIPPPDSQGRWHDRWRWLNFTGRWGSKGKVSWKSSLTLPIEEDGPTGPIRKGQRWNDPFAWIENECFDVENKSWILSL